MSKRNHLLLFAFLVVYLIAGCAPSPLSIQTAIAETQISLPVSTPSLLLAVVRSTDTQVPAPDPPVANSVYIGMVEGNKALFMTSELQRNYYESFFSSYAYLGKIYFVNGGGFDFHFKDLENPQLLLTIAGNEDVIRIASSGSIHYVSGIRNSPGQSTPLDSAFVYAVDLETGQYREVWTGQPGYVEEVEYDYLVLRLLPCYRCSPGPRRTMIILNGATGAVKELGEVGDVTINIQRNIVQYRYLTPIEIPCDPGEGCVDGFYVDNEPAGDFFSDQLP